VPRNKLANEVQKKSKSSLPNHVAIIMDGNGRWAQKRHMPRAVGHAKGAAAVRGIVEHCAKQGVKYLTLFAFSTENWTRHADEVAALMGLFLQYLEKEIGKLIEAGVRIKFIGDMSSFSFDLQSRIYAAELATEKKIALTLTIAANYGGQWDVIQAIKKWQAKHPDVDATSITQEELATCLSTSYMPDPDLLIRTGGEQRISNFMLWQTAYAEIYFTKVLWPDFDAVELSQALDWFATRERRFGRLGQIRTKDIT
jgi:undecaprenyl diphosphate synthase